MKNWALIHCVNNFFLGNRWWCYSTSEWSVFKEFKGKLFNQKRKLKKQILAFLLLVALLLLLFLLKEVCYSILPLCTHLPWFWLWIKYSFSVCLIPLPQISFLITTVSFQDELSSTECSLLILTGGVFRVLNYFLTTLVQLLCQYSLNASLLYYYCPKFTENYILMYKPFFFKQQKISSHCTFH